MKTRREVEASSYVTYEVYESVHSSQKFGKYDILLDNQADVSIVHLRLLRDVLPADSPITVNKRLCCLEQPSSHLWQFYYGLQHTYGVFLRT